MKHLLVALIVLAGIVVGVYYLITTSSGVPQNGGQTVFDGRLLYNQLGAQTITGARVLSDNGCKTDPNTGLSNCTAEIETQYGTIYFNYEHNMMMKPCLSNGDIVNIVIGADGVAEVTRTYWNGGGA